MGEEKTIGNSLHSATEAGDVAEIESLLALGFSIDRRNDEGRTPLMMAVANGELQAVKCLLKQGADPSLQDNKGWNVLHYASVRGNVAIMEEILSHGVDIESRNNSGETPLMVAKSYEKSEEVAYLLSKCAKSS